MGRKRWKRDPQPQPTVSLQHAKQKQGESMEGKIICHVSVDANRCLSRGNKLSAEVTVCSWVCFLLKIYCIPKQAEDVALQGAGKINTGKSGRKDIKF